MAPSPSTPVRRPSYLALAVLLGIGLLATSLAMARFASETVETAVADAPPTPATSPRGKIGTSLGYIDVEAGVSMLYPIQPGRVSRVLVHDNQDVDAGAPLFEMDKTLARVKTEQAKAALDAAKAQLELVEQLPAQHSAQIGAQRSAVEAKRGELAAARAKSEQATRLSERKLASAEDARIAQETVRALEAAVRAEEYKLEAIQRVNPESKIAQARADVEAKEAMLEEARFALNECTLRAPEKGRVLRMLVSVGEALGPNPRQPAVYFCPDAPRIARAEIEQEFATQFSVGAAVVITDDSSSERRWTGKVKRMGDWYTHRRSILQEALQLNDVRTLECIIEIDGGGKDLRIGQRVRVSRAL